MQNDEIYKIIKGLKGTFVYGILSKWYLLIAIPAMSITYIIFKALDDLGIFTMVEDFIVNQLKLIEGVAGKCIPNILNISEFIKCFNS